MSKRQTIKATLHYVENKNIISDPIEVILPYEEYEELQAESDRRLALLKDVGHEFENLGKCLICHSSDKMDGKLWHADGCELNVMVNHDN